MSYCMQQKDAAFKILEKNIAPCLEAIKSLNSTRIINDTATLMEAFKVWRWQIYRDQPDGNVVNIEFLGEKSRDENLFFQTIAPYVESGSFIEMSGEDGAIWRWKFQDQKMTAVDGELDWDDNIEIVRKILEKKELLPMLLGIHPSLDSRIAIALKEETHA